MPAKSPFFRCAITTKYLGPTDRRPSRVRARSGNGHSLTVSWDHSIDTAGNHQRAAAALAVKLGWNGTWVGGFTEDGYVFVLGGPGAAFWVDPKPGLTLSDAQEVTSAEPGRGDKVYIARFEGEPLTLSESDREALESRVSGMRSTNP